MSIGDHHIDDVMTWPDGRMNNLNFNENVIKVRFTSLFCLFENCFFNSQTSFVLKQFTIFFVLSWDIFTEVNSFIFLIDYFLLFTYNDSEFKSF